MTLSLAIIGNSHLSAVKIAYDQNPGRWPGIKAQFFGAPEMVYRKLRLNPDMTFGLPNRKKRTGNGPQVRQLKKINGVDSLALSESDAVLLLGARALSVDLPSLLATWDVEDIRDTGGDRVMSRALWSSTITGMAETALPEGAWNKLIRSGTKVLISYRPSYSATVGEDKKVMLRQSQISQILRNSDGLVAAQAALEQRTAEVLQEKGFGFIPQPAKTRDANGFTLERFSRESRRVANDDAHDEDDARHMNSEYGAVYLDAVVASLGV